MSKVRWTLEDPRRPGIYWVVLVPHDSDVAAEDIRDMARGLRVDPRPPVHVAEVFPDTGQEGGVIPWIAGMDDACTAEELRADFAEVWWCGPMSLPPPLPQRGPLRPFGAETVSRFEIPAGWPPSRDGEYRDDEYRDSEVGNTE